MKKVLLVISVPLLVTTLAFGVLLVSEKRSHDRLANQFKDAEKLAAAKQATLKDAEETAKELETKLNQMTQVLTNLAARLREATVELKENEAKSQALREAAAQGESRERLEAALPKPQKVMRSGTPAWLFPQLLNTNGRVLAVNAEFSAMYGRRIAFKYENGDRGVYDVDELHPGVLRTLGVDPEAAKARQAEKDAAAARKKAAELQAYQELYEEMRGRQVEFQQKWERQRKEQARLAEIQRQNQLNEQLRIQAAENDRLRAEATMRAADAAMVQALNPAYNVNANQQNVIIRR